MSNIPTFVFVIIDKMNFNDLVKEVFNGDTEITLLQKQKYSLS